MTTVSIFDDNILRASALLQAINNVEGFSCTHIFCNENDVKQVKIDVDLIIYCLHSEVILSKNLIDMIANRYEKAKLILCTDSLSVNQVIEGIKCGVSGFFTFGSTIDVIDSVLISVRDHQAYLPPYILKSLLNSLNPTPSYSNLLLTKREAEICFLLKEGRTYEQIAETCEISINTVRFFVKSVYKKYEVKSKIQLLNKLQQVNVLVP